MALAPCPECKKQISFKADKCPNCGHPITDDVRAGWKSDAKAKQVGCGMLILAIVAFGIYGWIQDIMAGPSGDVKEAILAKLPKDHPHIDSWAGDDLYGGTAVLINDEVGFWVKDGIVFAANGLAHNWGVSMSYSPPSVDQATVEKAAKGEEPSMPPTLGVNYLDFYQDVPGKVTQAKLSGNSYFSYKFNNRVHFELKEAGGQLTSVYIGFYAQKGQNKLPLNLVHAAVTTLHPNMSDQQAGEMLNELISAGFKEPGTTYTKTIDGISWYFTYGQKQDMNFSFKPETD